jgi:hypothetical protein
VKVATATHAQAFVALTEGGARMYRKVVLALLILILWATAALPVAAGGDKVRGDNGAGAVNQHQVMDPPPFQP